MLKKEQVDERLLDKAFESAKRWEITAQELPNIKKDLLSGGSAAADTSERVDAFENRELNRILRNKGNILDLSAIANTARIDDFDERMIGGTLDWSKMPPDELSAKAGKSVCRIVNMPETGEVINAYGFGTAFLVSPSLLLTNHHVLSDKWETEGVGANFEHEYLEFGGFKLGQLFELEPDTFFESNEELDFALVAVKPKNESGKTINSYGFIPLYSSIGKILVGQPVNIIQHPEGGPKVFATRKNALLKIFDPGNYLQYETDTLRGSSGSPAFNIAWEAVGLHHSSIPMIHNGKILNRFGKDWIKGEMDIEDIHWVANEAIRVSSIVNYLTNLYKQLEDKRSQKAVLLAELLNLTVDPLLSPENHRITLNQETKTNLSVGKYNQEESTQMGNITFNITGNANIYVNSSEQTKDKSFNADKAGNSDDPKNLHSDQITSAQLEKGSIRFDPDKTYKNRKGYDPEFLEGFSIPSPGISNEKKAEMLKIPKTDNVLILNYHHYSLVMNRSRRLLMWAAGNADYSESRRDERGRKQFGQDRWIRDERIPAEFQIEHFNFYKPAADVDRGHIMRREDLAWGDSPEEIEYSNSDTFHYTNSTPQHEDFNQSKNKGIWGLLENHITKEVEAANQRAVIFAGPVLSDDDPSVDYGFGEVQYPLKFWKIIIAVSTNNEDILEAYGFVLDQSDVIPEGGFGREKMDFSDFELSQRSVDYISEISGVTFDDILLEADVLKDSDREGDESNKRKEVKIRDLSDIKIH